MPSETGAVSRCHLYWTVLAWLGSRASRGSNNDNTTARPCWPPAPESLLLPACPERRTECEAGPPRWLVRLQRDHDNTGTSAWTLTLRPGAHNQCRWTEVRGQLASLAPAACSLVHCTCCASVRDACSRAGQVSDKAESRQTTNDATYTACGAGSASCSSASYE